MSARLASLDACEELISCLSESLKAFEEGRPDDVQWAAVENASSQLEQTLKLRETLQVQTHTHLASLSASPMFE